MNEIRFEKNELMGLLFPSEEGGILVRFNVEIHIIPLGERKSCLFLSTGFVVNSLYCKSPSKRRY